MFPFEARVRFKPGDIVEMENGWGDPPEFYLILEINVKLIRSTYKTLNLNTGIVDTYSNANFDVNGELVASTH